MGGIYDPDTGTFSDDEGVAGPEPFISDEQIKQAEAILKERQKQQSAVVEGALTADQARALLHQRHGVSIPSDDPILMFVTLQRRFLQDLQAVLKIHDKAIEAAITSTATTTVDAVNGALETLKDKTVRAGLSNAMALVERQGAAMEAFQASAKRHLRVMIALTLTSWLGLAVVLGLLWSLLR